MPERMIDWGLPASLVMSCRIPERVPWAVGVKLTFTAHVPLAAMLEPQVFTCEKSPLMAKPQTVLGAAAVFVILEESMALVDPTS